MTLTELEQLFSQGRYLEVRLHSEKLVSDTPRAQQLHAMALSKSGASAAAEKFFRPLYDQQPDDPETAGIMGSILKELFKNTLDQKYAIQSRDIYLRNFQQSGNYYTGINAAAMHAITGKSVTGREIATQVVSKLPSSPSDFWEVVTLAEAHLLLKKQNEAVELYLLGRKLAGADWGKVNSVHNQLWLMNHYVPVPTAIMKAFLPPNMAAFVGHMMDRNETKVRFPKSIESNVKNALIGQIKSLNIQIGFCSLACGGDILFAEALAEAGGELNIWLPFPKKDFLETSVRFAGQEWVERFERLEERWPVKFLTHEPFHGNNDIFYLHGRTLLGAAVLRSRMIHAEPYLITVLSGTDTTVKEGGTRDLLKLWPTPAHHHNIDPNNFVATTATSNSGLQIDSKPMWRTIHLVCIDLPALVNNQEEILNLVRIHEEEYAEELIYFFAIKGLLMIGMNTSYGAIRLSRTVIHGYVRKTNRQDFRAGFHAGVVEEQFEKPAKKYHGETFETTRAIMEVALPKSLLCSGIFATSLVLDPGKYSLYHAGQLEASTDQKLEMYTLEVNDL